MTNAKTMRAVGLAAVEVADLQTRFGAGDTVTVRRGVNTS